MSDANTPAVRVNDRPVSPSLAKAVGVREVAAHAGVSRQTVSRVLNDHPEVAEATKRRVLQAVEALGYRVNNAARALGTRRSHTIGVLASDALLYGPSRSIAAVELAAREAGYWVTAAFVDGGDVRAVRDAVGHLLGQAVDGLVVVAPHARTLDALREMRVQIPTAVLHSAGRDEQGFSVDQAAGARLATACLLDAGHERLAHVAGPADWLEAEARTAGFIEELQRRGAPEGVVIAGDWTAAAGYAAAARVIEAGVTGVFAANDQIALGLIGGLRAAGVQVPEEVSVVGFDDVPDAAFYWPPLTTVRQDFGELARRAVAHVTATPDAARDHDRAHDESVPVVPMLVSRASVVAPRG